MPRWRIAAALGLSVAVIAVIAIWGIRLAAEPPPSETGPVAVGAVDQPGAGTTWCSTLMGALPKDLSGLERRPLAADSPGVAAWGPGPVVLRCGLPSPAELTCSSALVSINGVAWLELTDGSQVSYLAVDRPVRVAVSAPPGTPAAPIQQMSDLIEQLLPARDICRNGVLVPPDA